MNTESNSENATTIKDVADFFGVTVRTIREWMVKDPTFPKPFKKFGTLRFKQSEIKRYWEINQNGGPE